jgi:adenosylcobyric acid synthase
VIEGAGSPAEVNLRVGDIANMRVALHAQAPVLLVGDIDRGGVFASLLGTLELLEPDERALVRGLVINRFRGDRAILEPLPFMIAARTGVPVVGVVPYISDLKLSDEDAASLEMSLPARSRHHSGPPSAQALRAAVIRLPRISNFDDFDPLRRAGVQVELVTEASQLDRAHMVLIPGTKSTIADLRWLKQRGLDKAICLAARRGAAVIGVCGGFQMLGRRLDDPLGADSGVPGSEPGLGLLPETTIFERKKTTRRVEFTLAGGAGLLDGAQGEAGRGYEIHTGRTSPAVHHALELRRAPGGTTHSDGAVSPDGWVMGTYVHGLFDSPAVASRLLGNIARRNGLPAPAVPAFSLDLELDRLAGIVRGAVDMKFVYSLLRPGGGPATA